MHPGQPPVPPAYPPRGYWPAPGHAPARPVQPPRVAHRTPRLRWVASPPPSARPRRRAVTHGPYNGPPSYPVPPRWGFPNLVWRRPTTVPGTASGEIRPIDRLPVLARSLVVVLWAFGALATVAAGAEIWRYVLLVQSRDSALNTSVVEFSDGFVVTAGLLTTILSLLPSSLALWWLLVARLAAAEEAGEDPPRQTWQVLLSVLVPVANLALVVSVLSELEHTILRRPRAARPRPSRLVLIWWATWLLNWVMLVLTIIWRLRGGIQALADSVVLVALTDLSAAALAVVTALVVRRFSGLLIPMDATGLRDLRVLKVTGAPDPELRTARPAGAPR